MISRFDVLRVDDPARRDFPLVFGSVPAAMVKRLREVRQVGRDLSRGDGAR